MSNSTMNRWCFKHSNNISNDSNPQGMLGLSYHKGANQSKMAENEEPAAIINCENCINMNKVRYVVKAEP